MLAWGRLGGMQEGVMKNRGTEALYAVLLPAALITSKKPLIHKIKVGAV